MRCLTLAEALRERGVETRFICREHPGNLIAVLRRYAIPVTLLPAPPQSAADARVEDYAVWLGVSQAEDADQTVAALRGTQWDWLIVDHYGLDIEWEEQVRPHVTSLLVIDDLPGRRHECDLLLNQNFSLGRLDRYEGLLPKTARVLLGPRYALLNRAYLAYRRTLQRRDGEVRRVLVFFGGTDPHNLTGIALEALSTPACRSLDVDVVIGPNNAHRASVETQAGVRPNTHLHGPRPHLADLIAMADIGISAGGATLWEMMCLGLPCIAVSFARNQRPTCEALHQAELIQYLGDAADVHSSLLSDILTHWRNDQSRLVSLSERSRLVVDGLGALRVAEVLAPTAVDDLRMSAAQAAGGADRRTFILSAGTLPVGQLRFTLEGDETRIDHELDECVDGRGWASRMIMLGHGLLEQSTPARLSGDGRVGADAPRAPFMRLGGRDAGVPQGSGATFSLAILSDSNTWLNPHLAELVGRWLSAGHRVVWAHREQALRPGDFCFYLGCGQIVSGETLAMYRHNLVVHESDLPKGRGWSPLTWQILEGMNRMPVTLLEASEAVDSGVIYAQEWLDFSGDELVHELRDRQAQATLDLCERFVSDPPRILSAGKPQAGIKSYYRRRRPADSVLDVSRTIDEQFNVLRVADNDRYPAYFERRGVKYEVRVSKASSDG